jgi:hypothetical protein
MKYRLVRFGCVKVKKENKIVDIIIKFGTEYVFLTFF